MFLWNFITALLTGTAVCAWAGYYSDKLPEISAVLGGGGVLVWATMAFMVVGQERQDAFRGWVVAKIIGQRAFTLFLLIACLGLMVIANFLASVEVSSVAEEGGHSVSIYRLGVNPPEKPARLDPAQPVRSVVWTSWFSPTTIVIKVPGYPQKFASVAPFHRVAVFVPASLRIPVLLFRPTQLLADVVKDQSMKLELQDEHGSRLAEPVPFDGDAILTGGDDEINIPSELEEKWRNEVARRPDLLGRWRTPIAPKELARLQPAEKQTILARILLANNQPSDPKCPSAKVVVNTLRSNRPFLQEVVLDVCR